jgi:hypothetical protein
VDIYSYYQELHKKAGDVLHQSLTDGDTLPRQVVSHGYLSDLSLWPNALVDKREAEMMRLALKEYQFALFALTVGQYRHAFIGLRLFFELSLASTHFSAHELELRFWEQGAQDIVWQRIISPDNGVLSKNFISAFSPALAEHAPGFRAIAERVYRECSEFVHGNAHTHTTLTDSISFAPNVCVQWHDHAKSMFVVILFTFAARYLGDLEKDAKRTLEPSLTSELGHLEELRALLD